MDAALIVPLAFCGTNGVEKPITTSADDGAQIAIKLRVLSLRSLSIHRPTSVVTVMEKWLGDSPHTIGGSATARNNLCSWLPDPIRGEIHKVIRLT